MRSVLKGLENEFLSFTYFSDATANIIDHRTKETWEMGPLAFQEESLIEVGHFWLRQDRTYCEQYPGRFFGAPQGSDLRFTLVGYGDKPMGSFTVGVKLNGPWLEFEITQIDESLSSLMFPTPIKSEMLVFPRGIGTLVRQPLKERFFWTFYSHLNMRWFGGLKRNKGWICLYEEGFENAGVIATQLSACPGWLKSLGKWTGSRKLKYCFCDGGYVALAKLYRRIAIETGLHVPLVEKIEATPALKNLHGGRLLSIFQASPERSPKAAEETLNPSLEVTKLNIHSTYQDVHRIMQEAQTLGMSSGITLLRGWIRGGYDYSHPDIWPPLPELGSLEELKSLCSGRGKMTVGLHDNYQDIYEWCPSFPKGVNLTKQGQLMAGGFWAAGRAFILNSQESVLNAKRNWQQLRALDGNCMFIDTTTAVQLHQSYEKGREQTRPQDLEYKKALLKFFKDQGQLLGSEESADFGVPYCDWLENRHSRVAGKSIPLWPLVFHDAVFCGRYQNQEAESWNPKVAQPPFWMNDLLWGYFSIFRIGKGATWDPSRKDLFSKSLVVDRWHQKVGLAAMLDHKYLTDDFEVEQTVFSSGHSIICNYSSEDRLIESQSIPARGYQMKD